MVIYLSSLLQNLIQGSRLLMNSKEKTRLIVLHFQMKFTGLSHGIMKCYFEYYILLHLPHTLVSLM